MPWNPIKSKKTSTSFLVWIYHVETSPCFANVWIAIKSHLKSRFRCGLLPKKPSCRAAELPRFLFGFSLCFAETWGFVGNPWTYMALRDLNFNEATWKLRGDTTLVGDTTWGNREEIWRISTEKRNIVVFHGILWDVPVNKHSELEHGHGNSGFSHRTWWFSIAILNYQRVPIFSVTEQVCGFEVSDFEHGSNGMK